MIWATAVAVIALVIPSEALIPRSGGSPRPIGRLFGQDLSETTPIYKSLSRGFIEKENVAQRLRTYREAYRRPLVDLRQIVDPSLKATLEKSWGGLFDLPRTLPEVRCPINFSWSHKLYTTAE